MEKGKINQLIPDAKAPLFTPTPFVKYESQLLYFLSPDMGNRDLDDIQKNYVEEELTEEEKAQNKLTVVEKLRKILDSTMDSVTPFVGYRGIGKTTDIRYAYSFWNNTVKLRPLDSTIIIPILFDSAVTTDNFDIRMEFGKRIDAVCEAIIDDIDLQKYIPKYRGEKSTQELHHFLAGTNAKAMSRPHIPFPDNEPYEGNMSSAYEKKLLTAEENDYFIYTATRLKYYMSKISHRYDRILIILDGVERLPEKLRIPVISQSIQMRKCLMNYPEDLKRKYNVNLLLSMQPCTYQEAKERGVIVAAHTQSEILKTKRINLQKYFNLKRSSLPSSLVEKDPEGWKAAYGILRSLSEKFDGKYAKMILGIANLDIPLALNIYRDILSNSLWMTRRDDPETYLFNNISVIRAIACGAKEVYEGRKDSLIPNLLYNTEQYDYSIECLYVMRYFASKNADFLAYGKIAETKQTVIKDLGRIFGYTSQENHEYQKFSEHINGAITYLYQCGILETTSFDTRHNVTEIASADVPDEKLLLSAKGNELLDMLQGDSVMTELFREDHFMQTDSAWEKQFISSKKFMDENDQISIFAELLVFLRNLFNENEKPYIIRMQNHSSQALYKNMLGDSTMVELLLEGVNKSINYSGKWGEKDNIIPKEKELISDIEKIYVGHSVKKTLITADNQ